MRQAPDKATEGSAMQGPRPGPGKQRPSANTAPELRAVTAATKDKKTGLRALTPGGLWEQRGCGACPLCTGQATHTVDGQGPRVAGPEPTGIGVEGQQAPGTDVPAHSSSRPRVGPS